MKNEILVPFPWPPTITNEEINMVLEFLLCWHVCHDGIEQPRGMSVTFSKYKSKKFLIFFLGLWES